jgi:hypothetical protein
MSNEIIATLREIMTVNPMFQQHMSFFARRVDVTNPYALADFVASLTMADAVELQVHVMCVGVGGRGIVSLVAETFVSRAAQKFNYIFRMFSKLWSLTSV